MISYAIHLKRVTRPGACTVAIVFFYGILSYLYIYVYIYIICVCVRIWLNVFYSKVR
jgi:hypothetical protein